MANQGAKKRNEENARDMVNPNMSSASVNPSGPGKSKRKNAPGNRSNPGWEHGIEIDNATKKVKCRYCETVRSGGIYRHKHHLAGTSQNVEPCLKVPEDVRKMFIDLLWEQAQKAEVKKRTFEDFREEVNLEEDRQQSKRKRTMDDFVAPSKKQGSINQFFKNQQREEVCQQICRFFYTSAIPFNCVNNPEFSRMVDVIGKYGVGLKPPSYHEMRVKFLNQEVEKTLHLLEEYKLEWKKTGCTIMSDGWTDRKRRSICNFLVNSPKGTVFLSSIDTSDISKTAEKIFEMLDEVVDKVGEENVVQVVTDNASNYKLAGEYLMAKRKRLFWTPCAAHCIDLMLEDFDKNIDVHKVAIARSRKITTYIYSSTLLLNWMKEFTKGRELIRPAVTRFATAYLTLNSLNEQKGALINMFTSNKWKCSRFARSVKGKKIEEIVLDSRGFWPLVTVCLKAASPLVKVLRMVDGDEKPPMGFIYEAMNQAKDTIQANFNNVQKSYMPILDIINSRWQLQLNKPLHLAAYYLNPHFHYSPDFKASADVKIGLYHCIERMVPNDDERVAIDLQIDAFKNAKGLFGIDSAIKTRTIKSPADWWDSYGDECPELKRFAIRILSLTCSSSGCERNWSAFEMVHSKRRNRLHQQKLNDLVFVMYNLKLKEREVTRNSKILKSISLSNSLSFDDIPSDDEWITEKENPSLPTKGNWFDILDRAAQLQAPNVDGDEGEVKCIARNLREACPDEFGSTNMEIHDISDEDNDSTFENDPIFYDFEYNYNLENLEEVPQTYKDYDDHVHQGNNDQN